AAELQQAFRLASRVMLQTRAHPRCQNDCAHGDPHEARALTPVLVRASASAASSAMILAPQSPLFPALNTNFVRKCLARSPIMRDDRYRRSTMLGASAMQSGFSKAPT